MMKKVLFFFPLSLFLLFITACDDDDDLAQTPIEVTLQEEYQTSTFTLLTITPDIGEIQDVSYKWVLTGNPVNDVTDSVLCTTKDLNFITVYSGTYEITLEVTDGLSTVSQSAAVKVAEEETQYSPYVTSMYDFAPAPGTLANDCYKEDGYTRQDVMDIALGRIDNTSVGYLLDLGSFGGSVIVGFDHTVVNIPGEKDFRVYGVNEAIVREPVAPGLLFVAYDKNGNGVPDDEEWYEIKGSSHGTDDLTAGFSITYHRPDPDKAPVQVGPSDFFQDRENVYCEPGTGDPYYLTLLKNNDDLCPLWLDQDDFSYTGKRLDVHIEPTKPGQYTLWSYEVPEWGYANALDPDIDIDRAIDQDGNEVHLPGIDFLKVVNCVSTDDVMIYSHEQTSMTTKFAGAGDLHLIEKYNL